MSANLAGSNAPIVTPDDLIAYLRAKEWNLVRAVEGKGQTWILPGVSSPYGVAVLATNPDLADYDARIHETLRNLAKVEGRARDAVTFDVLSTTRDVMRVRVATPGMGAGYIPLDAGAGLFCRTRDLVVAAAQASIAPKPHFPVKRPAEVATLLSQTVFGQTEAGSYTITVLFPSLRAQAPQTERNGVADTSGARARQTLVMLARSITRLVEIDRLPTNANGATVLRDAVSAGVSANLAEALAGLAGLPGSTGVGIDIVWATDLPRPERVESHFGLRPEQAPAFRRVARSLRNLATDQAHQPDELSTPGEVAVSTSAKARPMADGETIGRLVLN